MTTIDPADLATLVLNHIPFDLIDVRPTKEFDRLHIPGARCAPLNQMSAPKVLRERALPDSEPVFVISEDRALAGMAAGMLRGAGCSQPVVIDGGMKLWEAQHLPSVRRHRWHWPHRP